MYDFSRVSFKCREWKRLPRYRILKRFKYHHAKWVATFLLLYVLGTLYYVKLYMISQTDLNVKYCENEFQNKILEERSLMDKELHRRLSNSSTKTLPQSNFVVAHEHVFIYSAFLDDRDPPPHLETKLYIKIVSVVLRDLNEHYLPKPNCQLRVHDKILANGTAIVMYLPEDHGCCYAAAFIFCPVSESVLPTHVAVTIGWSVPQWIAVESLLHNPVTNNEIAVCVRPFYGAGLSIIQLADFISHHHRFGINNFQFYNASAPYSVHTFLNLLERHVPFSISLLQWNVPLKSLLVHEMGQIAFIQDCVLRWQTRVEYVTILDLDELLVPQKSTSLQTALVELKRDYPSTSAFIIPSIVFCDEYLPPTPSHKYTIPFSSLYNDQRQLTPWPHQIRSKYIISPPHVSVTGIHQVWKSVEHFSTVNIPAHEVVIYHYRTCCNLNQPWFLMLMEFSVFNDALRTDQTLTKTADQITGSKVYKVVQKIMKNL